MNNIKGAVAGAIGILVSAFALIFGLFFMNAGDEMGFMLIFMYAILPLTALVTTAVMSGVEFKGAIPMSLISVAIITVIPYALFHNFEWLTILFGLVPATAGYLFGMIFRKTSK